MPKGIYQHKKGKNHWNWKGGISRVEACRRWRKKHQKKSRQQCRAYYWKHKKERNKKYRLWYQKNKEYRKLYDQKRLQNPKYRELKYVLNHQYRAKRRKAKGYFSIQEWIELKKKYQFTCPNCQGKEPEIKLTPDHIIPLSKRGTNWISNIQPLCKSCNSKKNNKEIKYLCPV